MRSVKIPAVALCTLATVACSNTRFDPDGYACGETCLAGYQCHPELSLCVPQPDIVCETGTACSSLVETGSTCAHENSFVPCASGLSDCRAGCRTCTRAEDASLSWSACSSPQCNDGSPCTTYYHDNDGDGLGNSALAVCLCDGPVDKFTARVGGDCDDTKRECTDSCQDSDADSIADCVDPCVDVDGDGYGMASHEGGSCIDSDCDDGDITCTRGNCGTCTTHPETLVVTTTGAQNTCGAPVTVSIDVSPAFDALANLRCRVVDNQQFTLFYENFETLTSLNAPPWSSEDADFRIWENQTGRFECDDRRDRTANLAKKEKDKTSWLALQLDLRGFRDISLGYLHGRRIEGASGSQPLRISTCCGPGCQPAEIRSFSYTYNDTRCSAERDALGEAFDQCQSALFAWSVRFTDRYFADQSDARLDDIAVFGTPTLPPLVAVARQPGRYTLDIVSCAPISYEVECTWRDGVYPELSAKTQVTFVNP